MTALLEYLDLLKAPSRRDKFYYSISYYSVLSVVAHFSVVKLNGALGVRSTVNINFKVGFPDTLGNIPSLAPARTYT